MFRRILQHFRPPDPLRHVYGQIVAQARQPAFYEDIGVPDTVDGRFDMIVLHLVMVLRRLRRDGAAGRDLAQGLVDRFFEDMDHSLREMGVSDIAVPKRMKQMIKAFYGRAAAYEDAFAAEDGAALAAAIARNIFGDGSAVGQGEALARYAMASEAALALQDGGSLARGDFVWTAILAAERHDREV